MNVTIKKLIFNYLDNTYQLDLETLDQYMVKLKTEGGKAVSIATMYDDVKDMFSLHPYNCGQYFNEWIDIAALKLNNDLVDDLYDKYAEVRNTPPPKINRISGAGMALRAIHESNSFFYND